jgi:tetratricopeptide (TPR) repeat protein
MQNKNNRTNRWTMRRFLIAVLALAVLLQMPLPSLAQKGISFTPTAPPVPQQSVFMLRNAIKDGKVSLKIQGDGSTTSHIRVLLTNTNPQRADVVVLIPRFEIFHPGLSAGFQKMMAISDSMAVVPVGRTIDFEIPTVCADVKTVPPPNGQADFSVGPYGSTPAELTAWQQLAATVLAAQELGKQDAYKSLPIGAALDKQSQVMQLAIWRLLGQSSGNPANAVTADAITKDFLDAMAAAAKQNPELLKKLTDGGAKFSPTGELIPSKEQKKKTTDTSEAIFAAIDLTVRHSQEPSLANVVVPKTSWDGYYDVGMRTYDNGDFTEASELLGAAVSDARAFGEADDRLSQSLVGMGECYSDFGNLDGAEPLLTEALTLRQKVHGRDSVEVAYVDNDLGLLNQRKDLFDIAERFFTDALTISTKAASSTGKLVAKILNNLGRNFCMKNDGTAAVAKLQQAMVMTLQNNQNGKTPELAEIEANLASAYTQAGNYDKAAKFYDESLSIAMTSLGDNHPFIATILNGEAELAKKQDKTADAENYMKKAEEISKASFKKDSKSLERYPASYDAMKRFQLYCVGSNKINLNKEKLVKEAESLQAPSSEKAAASRAVADKWALVIGISKYKDSSINLRYSAKDAQDFADFLVKQEHFAKDHIHVLLDEQATVENIKSELGDKFLPRVAQPDDLVVIYLSGHGSPSKGDLQGTNFFVAYNTDKNKLYGTGLQMKELTDIVHERLKNVDRVVMLLDACHSGAIQLGAKGLFKVTNFEAGTIAQGSGKMVLCSSDPDEVSWESKRYPNGVFTHYLMDGFSKNGTNTKMKDAFDAIKENVYTEVLRDRGENQHPIVKSRWNGDDLVLGAAPAKPRPGMAQEDSPSPSVASGTPAEKSVKPNPVKPTTTKPGTTAVKSTSGGTSKPPVKPASTTAH